MASISSSGTSRSQRAPEIAKAEVEKKGTTKGTTTGVEREDRDSLKVTDGFDGPAATAQGRAAGQSAQSAQSARGAGVVEQLNGASTFEDCAPEAAVALALPNGTAVGSSVVDIKGTRSDSGTVGTKTDGEDCSPATIGEVSTMV